MNLGILSLKVIPTSLNYKQFAICTKQPIIFSRNETGSYTWFGALSTLELKRDTTIALLDLEDSVWTGILSDIDVLAEGKDSFILDFTPVLEAKGVNVPTTRYRKGKTRYKEITKAEEISKEEVSKGEKSELKTILINGISLKIKK